jgi:hypothetical protein
VHRRDAVVELLYSARHLIIPSFLHLMIWPHINSCEPRWGRVATSRALEATALLRQQSLLLA